MSLSISFHGPLAIAQLNSEATLNALSLEMAQALSAFLEEQKNNPKVSLIFLEGAGEKAFCAGGDIKRLYQARNNSSDTYPDDFFKCEYALDYMIHEFPKPIIVWGHGIVMGGGMGLLMGASHRVVTEKTKMAMPEISIGLFPDVGGSYFLSRLENNLGLFLALTGARLGPSDALYVRYADHYIASTQKKAILDRIIHTQWSDNHEENKVHLRKLMKEFESSIETGEIEKNITQIHQCMKSIEAQDILNELEKRATQNTFFKNAFETFQKGSPTSARIFIEQLKRGKNLSLKDVFKMELIMAYHFSREHDFYEGVRALLIDKDMSPHWKHKTFDQVPEDYVQKHFMDPWPVGKHPFENL